MINAPAPDEIETEEDAKAVIDALHEAARQLLLTAASYSMVLTIETKPLEPLAMGNYDLVINLRASNQMYRDL